MSPPSTQGPPPAHVSTLDICFCAVNVIVVCSVLCRPDELDDRDVTPEPARRVRTARVVIANHAQLRADIPELRACTSPEVDAWLLRHAALISEQQARQCRVNTPIEIAGEPIEVFRPPRYGRAFVSWVRGAPAGVSRLLDLKGTGVAPAVTPSFDGQSDGLLPLEKALADVAMQELIDAIFRHAGVQFYTVPTYAVLDLGFDIRLEGGQKVPAGLQVRRAHRRPPGGAELPARGSVEQLVKFEIELLLRHYGVTSCNRASTLVVIERHGRLHLFYGGKPVDIYDDAALAPLEPTLRAFGGGARAWRFDCVNIQNTRELSSEPSTAQLVDFGHYRVRDRFEDPVLSLVADRVLRWGGALGTAHPDFVVPEPSVAVPVEHWGPAPPGPDIAAARNFTSGRLRPMTTLRAYSWVERLRAGKIDGATVRALMDAHLATATERFQPPSTAD